MKKNSQSQPYDSSIKAYLKKEAAGIIPYLIPVTQVERISLREGEAFLDIEINRSTLEVDLLFRALYKGVRIILVIELQVRNKADLRRRLMAYHANLHLEHDQPVLILVLFLFEEGPVDLSYDDMCADESFGSVRPKVVRLRDLESEAIVREERVALYTMLPATNRPAVPLLKKALHKMHEHYDEEAFSARILWFLCLMARTKTMTAEEKQEIEEFIHMEDEIDTLLLDVPDVQNLVAKGRAEGEVEGEARGEARGILEGLQKAILEIACDCFSGPIVAQVQQTITPVQDADKLTKFLRQLNRVSDEEEVPALLDQLALPVEVKIRRAEFAAKAEGLREAIFAVLGARFSARVVSAVQQAITPIQDPEQLKQLLRRLTLAPDEQAVMALLTQYSLNPTATTQDGGSPE